MSARGLVCAVPTALLLALGTAVPAQAIGPDSYLGSVGLFANAYCPQGTLEANGQMLSIAENEALFQIYGTTYGGDGKDSFAVPDLSGKVPVPGMRYCVMLSGRWPDHD